MQKFLILFLLTIAPIFAQTDGPATLPQSVPVQTFSSLNLPKLVGPMDNLQAAINAAFCGDTLIVDSANETFGGIVFQNCLGAAGMTIQGNVAGLPDATHRVGPGLKMPKIILSGSQSVSGGGNVHLIGFEITRNPGTGIAYNLISPGSGAHDVYYDRLYVHGTPTDETTRGLMLHGHNISVVNSYFSDFHCFSQIGSCTDAQAIAGGLNDSPTDGSYLINNDYLEASGENILFGGGADTVTPCDITITNNDLTKQASWNPGDPSFAPVNGHPWVSKNLLEFKNICRALVDGNRLNNSWGGFSQNGFAILLTPKNQSNLCPICQDHDVTIRNNYISYAAAAMQIGFGPSDAGGWPSGAYNYSIHDNLFGHLQYATCYQCAHWLLQISTGNNNGTVMHDVTLDHNSFLLDYSWLPPVNANDGSGHGIMLVTAPTVAPFPYAMKFTNNLMPSGTYPIYTTGGGSTNCANAYVFNNYTGFFANCWSNAVVTGNTILEYGAFGQLAQIPWPAGNFTVKSGAPQ